MARSSSTVCTERRSVKGGWTDTSSDATSAAPSRSPRSCTVRMAGGGRGASSSCRSRAAAAAAPADGLAMSGPWRRGVGRVAQRVQPGQVAVLEELERRPAAGRDEADPPARPSCVEGGHRVAAAHHAEAATVGHRLGHGAWSRPRSARPRTRPWARSRTRSRRRPRRRRRPGRCSGPMSRPRHPAGMSTPRCAPRRCRAALADRARRGRGPRRRLGSTMRVPGLVQQRPAQLSMRPASSSESPTAWPWAARKVKAMPPPTTSRSTVSSSARSTPSLSATLAPPTTATKGRAGSASRPPEDLHLARQEAPGGRGQPGRAVPRSRRGRGARRRRRRSRRRRSRPPGGRRSRGRWPPRPGRSAGCRAAPPRGPARPGGPAPGPRRSGGRACPRAGPGGCTP